MPLPLYLNFTELSRDLCSNIYVISDTHFCHKNIRELVERPEDWKERIIEEWKKLPESATIFHLGDATFNPKRTANLFQELPGDKVLIRGNHDRLHKGALFKNFPVVLDNLLIRCRWKKNTTYNILLYHYPLRSVELEYLKYVTGVHVHLLIHGHTHLNTPLLTREGFTALFNASVEQLNYKPWRLEDVVRYALRP